MLMKSPSYNVPLIEATREKILEEICYPYYGQLLAGALFLQFTQDLQEKILPKAPRDIVFNTTRNLAGREFNKADAYDLACRVAGNIKKLNDGEMIPVWKGQANQEWVPVRVISVRRRRKVYKAKAEQMDQADEKGYVHKNGVLLKLDIMAGLPAGRIVDTFWSYDRCDVEKVHFGYDKWNRSRFSRTVSHREEHLFLDAQTFYNMRLMLLVDPELCRPPDKIGFKEAKRSSAALAWNRDLMELRLREKYVCPLNYSLDEKECFACHLGLDQCKAACHSSTFVQGYCKICHKVNVWLDPEAGENICVDCAVFSD